jgi:outer membrane receptor for ferrienterochelin and colicin
MRFIGLLILLLCTHLSIAQDLVTGQVFQGGDGIKSPLPYANVYWLGTSTGVAANADGLFELPYVANTPLIISFVGYRADTINTVKAGQQLSISLELEILKEVRVEGKTDAIKLDMKSAAQLQVLSEKELAKAPCCNLAESFETNASIDASFSDAATGQRQISMIGLTGVYAQIMQENIPTMRSGYSMQGLNFIPGPWVQSIQISKGAGSVSNGFESITGQINYELMKPDVEERMLLNTYANSGGRLEINAIVNADVSEKIGTNVFIHANTTQLKNDKNDDRYLDMPIGHQINFMNRWKYYDGVWEGQIGIHAVTDHRKGGYEDYDFDKSPIENNSNYFEETGNPFTLGSYNDRTFIRGFAKTGRVNPKKDYESIGLMASYTYYQDSLFYTLGHFNNTEHNAYFNAVYASIIGNTNFPFKAGASMQYDHIDQGLYRFDSLNTNAYDFFQPNSSENAVIGAFYEQSFIPSDKWIFLLAIRADYSTLYDTTFLSPRLNIRYSPTENLTFRANAGMGYRQPRPHANNLGLLMAYTPDAFAVNGYSDLKNLPLESAQNAGIGMVWKGELDYRPFSLTADVFYTRFDQRTIISRTNMDGSPQASATFSKDNPSYAIGGLVEFNYEILKRLDLRLAYRYTTGEDYFGKDATGEDIRALSYFNPIHKGLFGLAYATRKNIKNANWVADATLQVTGEQRIPQWAASDYTGAIDSQVKPNEVYSDPFSLLHIQVTRHFNRHFNVYVGVENALDERQDPVILFQDSAPNATGVYAPIFGRMYYVGLKYRFLKSHGS